MGKEGSPSVFPQTLAESLGLPAPREEAAVVVHSSAIVPDEEREGEAKSAQLEVLWQRGRAL